MEIIPRETYALCMDSGQCHVGRVTRTDDHVLYVAPYRRMMKVFDSGSEIVVDRERIRAAVPGSLDYLTQVQAVWRADHSQ